MQTSNRIQISAPFERLFELAADIARWPKILPHYRWVKILAPHPSPLPGERASEAMGEGIDVVAEMAARHKGLPLWWRTILRPRQNEKRIYFTHIGGLTKGMEVYWSFDEVGETCRGPTWLVQIHHQFNPPWPRPGPWFAERIIGEMFVKQVAGKTLQRMKEIAESQ